MCYQLPTFNALATFNCCFVFAVSLKIGVSEAVRRLNKLKMLVDDTVAGIMRLLTYHDIP
jgi:hypothetical protein